MGESASELNPGYSIGCEAMEHARGVAEDYCDYEKRRIEAANEPKILAGRAELCLLQKEEAMLALIAGLPRLIGDRIRRGDRAYNFAVAGVLTVAGLAFLLFTFEPYRIGIKAYFFCTGFAVVTPFILDKLLEQWGSERLRFLTAIAALSAFGGGLALAAIRGVILLRQISDVEPAVVFNELFRPVPASRDFASDTGWLLVISTCLLSVALELSAGLALFEARRRGSHGPDVDSRLAAVRARAIEVVRQNAAWRNGPAEFEARFWRDYQRARINGSCRRKLTKLKFFSVVFFALAVGPARTERLRLVVVPDVSETESVKGYDGRTELDLNVAAVSHLLASVPAGSKVTVVAITGESFSRPFELLSASVSDDPGVFGDRLASARTRLVAEWGKRSKVLRPDSPATDIVGALFLAGQYFADSPDARRALILYSDMRESVAVDLESPSVIPVKRALAAIDRSRVPALAGVTVYVLGVHAAGKTPEYWSSLRDLWEAFFRRCGAELRVFSMTREPPRFETGSNANRP